ncbi:ATP synthase F1 subunit delta [Mangrovibacterium sp.]|uniref:ATP synthase F1 subunit delta n=1 Tax=Mangrovibacterium sp. TaxID=1961364 RepID=UPI0035613092
MDQSKITVRYAKAFFTLAKEKNQLDSLKKDIELIFSLCQESDDFRHLLQSPVVKTSQKLTFMQAVFTKKIDLLTLKFLELITSNKREIHLPGICRNVLNLYRQDQGIKSAIVTTATELNATIFAQVKELLEVELKSPIELSKQVNPDLIGGFIIRIDDQQVDTSIATQLRKVRAKLLQSEVK